jgi:hypothetical protein
MNNNNDNDNNTGHAVEPNKSSGTSPPPVAVPAETALTGIPILDGCVRDYRMVSKVLAELRTGRVRGTFDALMQARSRLIKYEENSRAIALIDDALRQAGANIDEVEAEMVWATTRRAAVGAYIDAGEHCYEVSPGLAERLSVTELRGVTGDSLRLPFESIALVVPEELKDLAQVVFVSIRPAFSRYDLASDELNTEPVLSVLAHGRDATGFDTFAITPRLNDGDIRDALAQSLRLYRNDDYRTTLEESKERVTRLFWWSVNVCLYITHAGGESESRHPSAEAERSWQILDAEPGPKRRQRLLNLYNSKFRQRTYLGRGVEPLGISTRAPIGVRTLVAGHWRNQVCGVGRRDRRLTWIEPFWRGPREAPISNPIRVVTEGRVVVGDAAEAAA